MMNIGLLLIGHFAIQRAKPKNLDVQSIIRRRGTMKKKIFFLWLFFTEEKYAVSKKKKPHPKTKT